MAGIWCIMDTSFLVLLWFFMGNSSNLHCILGNEHFISSNFHTQIILSLCCCASIFSYCWLYSAKLFCQIRLRGGRLLHFYSNTQITNQRKRLLLISSVLCIVHFREGIIAQSLHSFITLMSSVNSLPAWPVEVLFATSFM